MGSTTKNSSIGKTGEDIAAEYLKSNGYSILERNIREKFGEIDILAEKRGGALRFVEVKTVSEEFSEFSGLMPEDNLSHAKLAKMKKMAEWYANKHQELVSRGYQIDLIAINLPELPDDSDIDLTELAKKCEIKLYENIF